MGVVAITVEEQIKKLKGRGMLMDQGINKAEEILFDIGYYRLGFYWYYYQNHKTHIFHQPIKLSDVVKLYYFDFDLKMLLLRYIYRIEVHFRTQLVYFASNQYEKNNTWYVDSKIVNSSIFKEFNNIYFNLKTKTNTLKKHHNKHSSNYAPAWKVFEFLTFGQVFRFYSNLKSHELKKKIANSYTIRDIALLESYFLALINIRNICSHNGVLFDYNQPYGIKRIPSYEYRIKTNNSTNMNASIKLILFMLSKISKNRANDLKSELNVLFSESKKCKVVEEMINSKIKLDI
ncbi:MAG: Abi family protein [Maribacter dokdonensis]|uniref:Abi family protein n=1 Tax=Maribacter dokdonensis TaxID=320912 RepID=UPI0032983F48